VPQSVQASARDAAAVVTWSPPADSGGARVDAYAVTVVETGRVVLAGAAARSVLVSSLSNGQRYTFTVAARNAVGSGPASAPTPPVTPTRPNIVLVVTDDQRADSLAYMPWLRARTDWLRFRHAYVNEPQCCPSRASILTGRYSHHTGVETLRDGARLDESRTIATMLRGAGYRTGFFGKYLNNYPFGRGPYVPPGWDRFFGMLGGGYYGWKANDQGVVVSFGSTAADYSTDVLSAKARQFVRTVPAAMPLFAEVAYFAPHRLSYYYPVPAPRHAGACADVTFPLPGNFNAFDAVSEPGWMAGERPVASTAMVTERRAMCATMLAVDEGLRSILAELSRAGRLGNTYVLFTSDNGYSFGEHRLQGKGHLYEEAVRVPLVVKGPRVLAGTLPSLVSNVDIAPTIAQWTRVDVPSGFFDGVSFAAVARRDPFAPGRPAVLLRGCRTGWGNPTSACGGYPTDMGMNWGLRTDRFKYVEYPDGYRQLFDVSRDPLELSNVAQDPAYASTVADLHARLVRRRGF
jgi:arylsulfatase A-like enzyme